MALVPPAKSHVPAAPLSDTELARESRIVEPVGRPAEQIVPEAVKANEEAAVPHASPAVAQPAMESVLETGVQLAEEPEVEVMKPALKSVLTLKLYYANVAANCACTAMNTSKTKRHAMSTA